MTYKTEKDNGFFLMTGVLKFYKLKFVLLSFKPNSS